MITYVADQRRDLDARRVSLGDDNAAGLLDPALALLHDVPLACVRVVLAGVLGVLERRELVLALDFDAGELLQGDHGEDIEDELLELDAVGLLRLDGLASLDVDAGDLLAGHVVRQLVRPRLDRLEEAEGVVVVDDVGSAELEHVGLLGVFGLRGLLVDLGVLHDVGLAVLQEDQADGLSRVALAHDLGGDINVLGCGKADEHGIGDPHQAVVNAIGVDVLNAALAHVLPHARCHKSLVDTAVSVRGDSNLYRSQCLVPFVDTGFRPPTLDLVSMRILPSLEMQGKTPCSKMMTLLLSRPK